MGSEFEINISSKDRAKIGYILHDLDKLLNEGDPENPLTLNDLLLIFEDPKIEMLKLLTYSLSRHKNGVGLNTQIVSLRTNSIHKLEHI